MSIELQIGANVQPAITPIKQLQDQLKQLKVDLANASDPADINRLSTSIVDTKNKIQQAEAATNGFATSTFGVSRATRTAHQDLEEMSRSIALFASGNTNAIDSLSRLEFSFQRLSGITGGAKAAFAEIGEILASPTGLLIGLSVGASLLGEFISKLFDSGDAADAAKVALDKYNDTLKDIKTSAEQMKSALAFGNQLGAINVKIFNQGDLENLHQQSIAQQKATQDILDSRDRIRTALKGVEDNENLSDKDRLELQQKYNEQLDQNFKDETESRQKQLLIYREIAQQHITDASDAQKKEDDLNKQSLEKLRQIIEQGKKLQSEFGENFKLDVRIFDFESFSEQLKKADVIVKNFNGDFQGLFQTLKQLPDIKLPETPEIKDKLSPGFNTGAPTALREALLTPSPLEDLQKQIQDTQKLLDQGLTRSFENMFKAIEQGKNPIKAFFQAILEAVEQLIAKLLAAAATELLLSVIFPGGGQAASGIGNLLGLIPHHAQGGIATRPTFGIFGEAGPEALVPLDRLKGLIGGKALNNISIEVNGVVKGNDLALLLNRQSRSDKRTNGK